MTAPAPAQARYELGDALPADRVEIRDQATGEVVLICHRYTAGRWLAWQTGPPAGPGEWIEDNDFRVCRCRHLCASHASTLADYSHAPGVGNGQCGVDGCGCGRFDLAIGRPTPPGLDPAAVRAEMRRTVRHFQRYTDEQRANRAASHRLGHRQRQAVGEVFFTHPAMPGRAFGSRRAAAEAAVRRVRG
ncbi:hypothetical protein ABZ671_01185 [Micromonospora sp. NPDC006766]|uniref:hypothetical protein n=1 Tax=Micromonospora sp. NPDC006766 TaxID=3154778 RepID=UPI0034097AB1